MAAAYVAIVVAANTDTLLFRVWALVAAGGFLAGTIARLLAAAAPCARWALDRAALVAAAATVALLLADNGFILFEQLTGRRYSDVATDFDTRRLGLAIRRIFPTDENFQTYVPNVAVSGWRRGDLVGGPFIEIPRLARMVVEHRYVTYVIDAHGFRETTPLERARVFALGDSMTFGSTTQELTWPKVLEARLGIPVYNLGVSGASPRQEFLLLRHLLATKRHRITIRHLVWMLTEINDLEDSYADMAPPGRERRRSTAPRSLQLAGALLRRVPHEVRARSVVHRIASGELRFSPAPRDTSTHAAYFFEGRRLPTPMYTSDALGPQLFHPEYIENAIHTTRDYVLRHPNRPRLDLTFDEMAALSRREGFRVTVVVVPSDVRLYAPYYRDFPRIAEPAFAAYVTERARAAGFDVLDLLPILAPIAEREVLFFRDDTHLNERGNALVAQAVADFLRTRDPELVRERSPR